MCLLLFYPSLTNFTVLKSPVSYAFSLIFDPFLIYWQVQLGVSFETSVKFSQATRHQFPDDIIHKGEFFCLFIYLSFTVVR
jgi:hypothetical protein